MSSFLLSSNQAYVELKVGVKRHVCFTYIVRSKTRSKHKRVIQSDQDVQVCGIFFVCVRRVDELLCMIHLTLFFFHGCGLSFSFIFFLTCFVGMWHTFFGYTSFF